MNEKIDASGAQVPCISLLAARPSNGPLLPRPETVRMADHILNHYAKDSRKDHICIARRLEKWAHEFAANERNGNLNVELASMTQERDELRRDNEQLRREVDELVHIAESVPCYLCNARDFCDNQPAATPCGNTLRAWAKQQAAQAGKEGGQ